MWNICEEMLACFLDFGLDWMIMQIAYYDSYFSQRNRVFGWNRDLWTLFAGILVAAYPTEITEEGLCSIRFEEENCIFQFPISICFDISAESGFSLLPSGVFASESQTKWVCIDMSGAGRALANVGVRKTEDPMAVLVLADLSAPNCDRIRRVWLLELHSFNDGSWKIVDKVILFTFVILREDEINVVKLYGQAIDGRCRDDFS